MSSPRLAPIAVLLTAVAAASVACSSSHHDASGCNIADPNACAGGAVCEPVSGGQPACFAPVVVKGQVTDLATSAAVAAARVVALDANRAPVSAVATTDSGGNYALTVPATRDASGKPASASVTLRADAQSYQSFPGGLRTALPVDLSTATSSGGQWVVQGPLTSVKLIALPSASGLVSLPGTVAVPASRVGVLVVARPTATPSAGGLTAIADVDGSFTLFNLPAATATSYTVNAYAQGTNYGTATETLVSGTTPSPVSLAIQNTSTATINGSLILRSSATAPTSVTLVVQSTYDAHLDRGESPPGLAAQIPAGTSYAYTLTGVPDGTYLVLAAFGIDGDVRDESGTGNTTPPVVTVSGGALQGTLGQFAIVQAIDLTTIDGLAVSNSGDPISLTSASPVFVWAKHPSYSQAATFKAEVFDAFGTSLWTDTQSGSGAGPFQATYGGPALQSGTYYQLRVTAFDGGIPPNSLSQTEDLKGVFFKP